jgi:ABC-type bacteriocin/lantibiotic exporter with double-glycine peptidase domain
MGLSIYSLSSGHRRAGLGVFVLLAQALHASAVGPEETTTLDCGVNSLFVLHQLEGRAVTLDHLNSVLPPSRREGYSMAELSAASRSLGLEMEGIQFTKGDKALSRPAIAFLKDARGGHFAVLRPVGTTGKMVQVIDPPHAPWIADYDRVFSARPWTGRLLYPRASWSARYAHPLLLASVCSVLLIAFWPRKRLSKV